MRRAHGPRKVLFTSQSWAEAYSPRPTDAVVSITKVGTPPAALVSGWGAVLRVSFDDIDPLDPADEPVDPDDDACAMQAEHARQIAAFVQSLPIGCDTLVIHCRYGQSRSAAVARAVCEHFGLPFPAEYEHDNRHVYETMRLALRGE